MAAQNATQPLDKKPDNSMVEFINKTEPHMIRARCVDCSRDLGFWKKLEKNFYCGSCGQMHGW